LKKSIPVQKSILTLSKSHDLITTKDTKSTKRKNLISSSSFVFFMLFVVAEAFILSNIEGYDRFMLNTDFPVRSLAESGRFNACYDSPVLPAFPLDLQVINASAEARFFRRSTIVGRTGIALNHLDNQVPEQGNFILP
jgi:hypothetical protein